MTTPTGKEWEVTANAPDDIAYEALAEDRAWNAFSMAELEPPFRAFSAIAVAHCRSRRHLHAHACPRPRVRERYYIDVGRRTA
jgi:hypothetical protein